MSKLLALLICCLAGLFVGCGSGSQTAIETGGGSEAVAITQQPASLATPIGRSATFSVSASGVPAPTYQWSKDGADIPGATSSSYTTGPVELGEDGSTAIGSFTVTVTNATNSVTSNSVTLTAGPRAPAIGDLRYLLSQQVIAPGLGNYSGEHTDIYSYFSDGGGENTAFDATNAVGSPLSLGSSSACDPSQCGRVLTVWFLPPGSPELSMYYKAGEYSNFVSDLESIAQPNVVITSLDLEPSNNAYAVSWVQTAQAGGFDCTLKIVAPAQLASLAAQEGAAGRIITASSFDGQAQANLVSCGWASDATTVYETSTAIVTPANIAAEGEALAAAGYVISAFGGNDSAGYILVGTRVKGDTLPRPVSVSVAQVQTPAVDPDNAYYTTVVYFDEGGYTILAEQ